MLPSAVLLQQQSEDEGEGGRQPVGKHLPAGTGVRGGRTLHRVRSGGDPDQPAAGTPQPPSPSLPHGTATISTTHPRTRPSWGGCGTRDRALITTVLNFVLRQPGNTSLTPRAPWDGGSRSGCGQGAAVVPTSRWQPGPPLAWQGAGQPFPMRDCAQLARSPFNRWKYLLQAPLCSRPRLHHASNFPSHCSGAGPKHGERARSSGPLSSTWGHPHRAPRSRAGMEGHPWVPT